MYYGYTEEFKALCNNLADEFSGMTDPTVRKLSRRTGIPKTTLHKYLAKDLPRINRKKSLVVEAIFEKNKSERALRGGMATAAKYKRK